MRASLHRRRQNLSLPPQPRRKPAVLVVAIALTTATVAFAASHIGHEVPAESATVRDADQATRSSVDERIRVHLVRLERGAG